MIDIGVGSYDPSLDKQTKLILESDVFRSTMKSTLPSAEKFQDCERIFKSNGLPSEKSMDNSIQIFNFENNTIRTIEIDNTIWFVAKDVASALGYSNTADAVKNHCKRAKSLIDIGEVIHRPVSRWDTGSPLSPENQTKMILESDVYRLTLKSTLEFLS